MHDWKSARRSVLSTALSALCVLCGISWTSAVATDWTIVGLADGGSTHPDIDGYRVVWTYGGSVEVYNHLSGRLFSIPESWGPRNWLVQISGDRVAWIRDTDSTLRVYDLGRGALTHTIDVGDSKLFGLSGDNVLLFRGLDLYLLNLRTGLERHIGEGGGTPTGWAPFADIDGDRVVYAHLLKDACGRYTPEVFLWNGLTGSTLQLSKNFDEFWTSDCKPKNSYTITNSQYPRVSGDTVVWVDSVYPTPPSGSGRLRCMIWQGIDSEPFPFLDNPSTFACDVPDVSDGRFTWVEYDAGGISGRRLFHDMATGETKVVPTGPWVGPRLAYLSGSNLALVGSVNMAVSDDGDQDRDGILDKWEFAGGVDWDDDGQIDLPLPGADPEVKNLYVEVDAMRLRAPDEEALRRVVRAFADAPIANLDGTQGIRLHIDYDPADFVFWKDDWPIPDGGPVWPPDFDTAKARNFGGRFERQGCVGNIPCAPDPERWETTIKPAREQIYRYCIFANRYGSESTPTDEHTSSGLADGAPGTNFMVTLGGWSNPGGTVDEQAGTFMHELGHTLGLKHGGFDDVPYKPNYFSVMNYTWQTPKNAYSASWLLDYSKRESITLKKWELAEPAGLEGRPGHVVPVGPAHPACGEVPGWDFRLLDQTGPVDWNCDGDDTDLVVSNCWGGPCEVNWIHWDYFPSPNADELKGYNDWAAPIVYRPFMVEAASAAVQSPAELGYQVELTAEMNEALGGSGTSLDSIILAPAKLDRGASGELFEETFVGLALANPNDQKRQSKIVALDQDGKERPLKMEMGTIPALGQKANLTSELVAGSTAASTLMAEGIPPELKGFFLVGDFGLNRLDGVGGVLSSSDDLYLPLVRQGNDSATYVFLFSPTTEAKQGVWLRLFDADGVFQAQKEVGIAYQGSLDGTLNNIFGESLELEEGYLEVVSAVPLRGFELQADSRAFHALPAQAVNGTDRLYAPHFFVARDGGSTLRLLNAGNRDAVATVKGYSDSGALIGNSEVTLGARKLYRGTVSELLGLDTTSLGTGENLTGYLTIELSNGTHYLPKVTGALTFQGNAGQWVSTLPLLEQGSFRTHFLHVAQSVEARMFTGLAILNPGDSEAAVTVHAYGEDGTESGTKDLKIAAGQRVVDVLAGPQFFGAEYEQIKGHFLVESDQPVMAFALFGSSDLRFMSAIEGQE